MMIALLIGGILPGTWTADLNDSSSPVATVGYLASPPVLDGRIEAAGWAAAGRITGLHRLDSEEFLPAAPEVCIGFDDRALYLAMTVPLLGGGPPQANVSRRDGPVWTDDALEIFLDPRHDHQTSYQFVVNAAALQADLLNQDLAWDGDWSAQAAVAAEAWSVEVAIPWTTLGLDGPPEAGNLGFNLGWDCQHPRQMIGSWTPLAGSFHQPEKFGHLLLRRQGPAVRLRRATKPGHLAFEATAAYPVPSPLAGSGEVAALAARLSVRRGETLIGESWERLPAGKPVILAVALPIREGRLEGGDYRCEMVAQIAGEHQPVARMGGLVQIQPPLKVTLRPYFIAGKLLVEADAAGLEGAAAALEAKLRAPDNRELASQRQKAIAGPSTLEFSLASWPSGTYAVEVAAADAAGDRLAAVTVPLEKPESPAWLHSQAGFSDQVLPPWTPIEVEERGRKKSGRGKEGVNTTSPTHHASPPPLTLKVSGRAYRFASLPFPIRITTRGAAILAAPLALRAWVDGREVSWRGGLQVARETPAQVVLSGSARGRGARLDSTLTLDFDGNARVEVRLAADRPIRLEKLVLEAPIKRTHARYLYHFPGSWGSSRNARALPEEGWASAFVPYVWLGDEDRGFALYTESDEYWQLADPNRAVEVTTEPQRVTLRLNLIGRPMELTPTEPASGLPYTFGFVATPVKTPDKDVWDYRICHYGNYGLEKQTVYPASSLRYPAAGNLNLTAGTLEMWVRVRFDPQAPVTDYASPGILNRDLLKITGGNQTLGFYWNIDDRGMRVYLQQDTSYPFVGGAPSDWREGEWHHLALSWGEELRAYVDGQLTVHVPWRGLVAGPLEQTTVEFGGAMPGFDVDGVRIVDVQREPQITEPPFTADEHTLLLDPLDRLVRAGRVLKTVPARGTPGEVGGRGELVAGRSGQALALAGGQPQLLLDYLKELGVRTIVFHEHWTEYQNYPETFIHQEELKSLVRACHERGLQLLLYFGYLMADTCPEWQAYHDEMLVMPQQGEYRREPEQKAYAVCYRSAWQDFLADGIAKLLDKYDIDGVYLDGTEWPWACQNVHHGCGYVRPDGTIAPTYGIFPAREMVRRIYTLVKNHRPEGQVNIHNSTVMTIPSLGWGTSSWDGEQFGSIPRGANVEELLPLDAFRCEFMGRQWGVPAEFLCYDRPYTCHEALSFTLLHDVLVRGSGPSLEEEAALWRAMEAFGRKQAQFLPSWNNAAYVQVAPEHCYVTLYSRGKQGVMCVVSNLGSQRAQVKVRLNLPRLKLPASVQAVDALTGDPIAVAQGTFEVALESFDYVLVQVMPRPGGRPLLSLPGTGRRR